MKYGYITLAIGICAFLVPFGAYAANHKYTCGDINAHDGLSASCTGDNWTIPDSTGTASFPIDSNNASPPGGGGTANFPLTNGTTYYVYATGLASSGHFVVGARYQTSPYYYDIVNTTEPGTQAFSFTSTAPTGAGLFFGAQDSAGYTPVYIGTTGNICISDVSAGDASSLCSGGGGGGGTATDTSATSTVEQTEQNVNWGFGLFIASMWFIMWMFKRR